MLFTNKLFLRLLIGHRKCTILDYTCRARWPEGLLCSTISLKSCNLAQILQSPKSEFVTCVMLSTHTNTSLIKPHLTELDEIHRNRPKSNYNLAKNLQSWSVTSDIGHQTHIRQTEIHTFFIWYPRVGREHNSPSGNENNSMSELCLQLSLCR